MDRLIAMVMNGFLRQLIRGAMNYGIGLAAGKGKPRNEMTADERAKEKQYSGMAKQARQVQKITRRLF